MEEKFRIKHKQAKSQNVIIGSSAIAVDANGIAEVSEETYNSVAGLKNWTRFLEDGAPESKETAEVTTVEAQGDIVDEALGGESSLLKSEVERLLAENAELSEKVETLEAEVKDLNDRLTYGAGKTAEDVNKDLKKATEKPAARKRGK